MIRILAPSAEDAARIMTARGYRHFRLVQSPGDLDGVDHLIVVSQWQSGFTLDKAAAIRDAIEFKVGMHKMTIDHVFRNDTPLPDEAKRAHARERQGARG
jgi:heme-degrading monooxygenase HmoA